VTQQRDGPSSASEERAIRRGASAGHGRGHPSEFEAKGFSIPRLASGFVRRVGRLFNGN
jgi:hypothetical protein